MLETNRLVAMPDTEFGAEVGILSGLGHGGGGGGGGGGHGGGGHGGGGHGGSSIFIGGGWGGGGWGGWYPPAPCDPLLDPYCMYPYPYAVGIPVPVVGAGITLPLSGMGFDPEAYPAVNNATHIFVLVVSLIALYRMSKNKK
jgi:hypothetical protein